MGEDLVLREPVDGIELRGGTPVLAGAVAVAAGVGAAWFVLAFGAAGAAFAAVFATVALLMAVRLVRSGTRATPEGLVVCEGLRTRRIPWADVQGFRHERSAQRSGLYVLVAPDELIAVPVPRGDKAQLDESCVELERYWRTHVPAADRRSSADRRQGADRRSPDTRSES